MELCFPRRGRYQQNSFGLATRFPFAFLTKTRRVPLAREILVYPPVEPTDEFFEVLPLITGEFETFLRGRGDDLYLIREYMPEDSARHVDWKATAKSGSLKVREFSREDERKVRLIFDNPAPGSVSDEAYENAVTLAASLGWHFAEAIPRFPSSRKAAKPRGIFALSLRTWLPCNRRLRRRCSRIWKSPMTTTSF